MRLRHAAMQVFAQEPGLWVVEVMWGVVHNLHDVAFAADEALQRQSQRPHCLEACGSQLQKCFAEANAGRGAPVPWRCTSALRAMPFRACAVATAL